jgi:hypothetical protein
LRQVAASAEFWLSFSASVMMDLTVARQRPQLGLHPRQRYTAPGVRGAVSLWSEARTFASERTLQEQMITMTPKAIEQAGRKRRSSACHTVLHIHQCG